MKSEFTGSTFEYVIYIIIGTIITTITLGLGFTIVFCMIKKWETEHTYIEGKQLEFTGDPFELFGKYIIWWVLTIITIGIYSLFIPVRLKQWEVEHTQFA